MPEIFTGSHRYIRQGLCQCHSQEHGSALEIRHSSTSRAWHGAGDGQTTSNIGMQPSVKQLFLFTLLIKRKKLKITMRCHSRLPGWPKLGSQTTSSVGRVGGTGSAPLLTGTYVGTASWDSSGHYLRKPKRCPPRDPAIPLRGFCPTEVHAHEHQETRIRFHSCSTCDSPKLATT